MDNIQDEYDYNFNRYLDISKLDDENISLEERIKIGNEMQNKIKKINDNNVFASEIIILKMQELREQLKNNKIKLFCEKNNFSFINYENGDKRLGGYSYDYILRNDKLLDIESNITYCLIKNYHDKELFNNLVVVLIRKKKDEILKKFFDKVNPSLGEICFPIYKEAQKPSFFCDCDYATIPEWNDKIYSPSTTIQPSLVCAIYQSLDYKIMQGENDYNFAKKMNYIFSKNLTFDEWRDKMEGQEFLNRYLKKNSNKSISK